MQLWDKFLEEWPPERVRSMSLEEYTNLNRDDAFVYWLEFRTRELGSIRGGSAFKFGVFRRDNQDSRESRGGRIWGDRYAWLSRYGETAKAAFAGVRSRLIQVIDATEAGYLAAIDEVDLSRVLKWKVAFLYQDRENPGILALYKKDLLAARYKEAFPSAGKAPPSQQHAALIEHYSWLGDALDISPAIWRGPEEPGPVPRKSSRRYWLMSLGRQSRRWPAYYESGTASIGYDQHAVGDLGKLRTRQAIRSKTKEYDIHALRAFWDFPHVMEPGDIIFVKRGQHHVLGHGVVQSEYRFDPERTTHKHLRDVRWDSNYAPGGRRVERNLVTKALTDITEDVEQVNELKIAVGLAGSPPPGEREEVSTPTEVEREAASDPHPFNQVLYGPPGTGKTYATVGHALSVVGGVNVGEVTQSDKKRYRKLKTEGRVAMVTFHQNYAYEDFVEGIRPKLAATNRPNDQDADAEEASPSSELGYELRPGHFRRICEAAETERLTAVKEGREPERFVLIIDEINRGNIPKIFGELITLIEDSRRLGESDETSVTLPYSGDGFGVPNNLYVMGTMNTADRSIQQLDTALRRRFTFVEMMPEPDHELVPADVDGVDCREMLRAMNERIAALMDREHQIGHTYLFNVKDLGDLADRFRNRIFPLLQEYFYDDWRKIRAVLGGNAFVKERKVGEGHAKDLIQEFDLVEEETVIHERLPAGDPAWKDAGQYRQIYDARRANPDAARSGAV